MQVFGDRFQAKSWLCLEAVIINLHETYHCRMCSEKLLMMVKEDARNMQSFITE
jgi:DNA-directed RNA polymerase subunit RPC12/RpoP